MRVLNSYEMMLIAGGYDDNPQQSESGGETENWYDPLNPDGFDPTGIPQVHVPYTPEPNYGLPEWGQPGYYNPDLPQQPTGDDTSWWPTAPDYISAIASGQSEAMLALSADFAAHRTVINAAPYAFGGFAIVMTAHSAYHGDLEGTYKNAAATLGGMAGAALAMPTASAVLTALGVGGATVVFAPGAVFLGVATGALLGTMGGNMLASGITMEDIFEFLHKIEFAAPDPWDVPSTPGLGGNDPGPGRGNGSPVSETPYEMER